MSMQALRKLSGWVGAFAAASLLAACGGGGGSPGTNANGQQPSKAANVVLTASAGTIASSGQDGTEVTLTAIVKDSNNNTLPNETVSFKSSSGNISNTNRTTDANGVVTEKLNVKGDTSLRDITITASAGGATSNSVTVKVVSATQTLTLTTDAGTLQSAGAAGSEVTVTALVKDSNNSVMAGVPVTLSADSGSLTNGSRVTDATGRVTEKLSTGGDATSRTIKVTASISGLTPVTANVLVSGTKLQVNANSTVNTGSATDVTVKLVDSAGNPLVGKTVTFSASNSLSVKGGGAAVTNSAGQLVLTYAVASGSTSTQDTITVSSMGESASAVVAISAANFTVKPTQTTANINSCILVNVHTDNVSSPLPQVMVSSSRGTVYTDASCLIQLTVAKTLSGGGDAQVYVQATSPGVATLTANLSSGGITQGTMEFVAPLTASSSISVQADPGTIGANSAGSTSQQATIRAIVRDGTSANNLVKGALVTFSIVSDPSGGSLSQPAVVPTGGDGSASVSFIAGSSSTALNGVVIRAQLQGASSASSTVSLTVSKKALFISAGTGIAVGVNDPTTYTKDYAVVVTDANGNAVSGVNVTASVLPRYYYKGQLEFFTGASWGMPIGVNGSKPVPFACPNEDTNGDGILNAGEDTNGNGVLDPGIPVTVTSSGTTDASGKATVTLTYPRDRALWTGVDLTIRGSVSGSEAIYKAYVPHLVGAASDYSDVKISPPGASSPYGQVNTGTAADCTTAN